MTSYPEIRAAGKVMIDKALDATKHLDFNPMRIAKRMTIPVAGRSLVFDGETDQNAFLDFWACEYRVNGKLLVESVDPVAAGMSPLETDHLQACRDSRTSFFQIKEVRVDDAKLRLLDLLEPDRPDVWLTDLGLSRSVSPYGEKPAMFVRLLTVRDFTMTSGFTFGFRPEPVPGILQAYRQKMKKQPAEGLAEARFIFFLQKWRQIGLKHEYQDVS